MGKEIFISIIIPAYNASNYIQHTIKTISQIKQKKEIIVIDDGSTDDTYKICKKLEIIYPELFIHTQKNQGVSAARNLGIQLSQGKWLFFCDADDWIHPENLTYILDNIKEERNIIFWAKFSVLPKPYGIQRRHIPNNLYVSPEVFLKSAYYQSSSWNYLFPASIVKKNNISFPIGIVNTEDQNFNIKCICCCNKVQSFDIPVYYYNFLNNNSASHINKSFKWQIGPLESALNIIEFCVNKDIDIQIITTQINRLVEYYYLFHIYGSHSIQELIQIRSLLIRIAKYCPTISKSPKFQVMRISPKLGIFLLKKYNKIKFHKE